VRLIDDLLDVTRARRGRLTVARARVSLRRVIDLALELSMPALRERGHRLTVNASVRGVWLVGDEARLAQVVSNLLSNAARYTPRGGNVELEVSASIDEVVVRVRDDGIGMSRTLCETAFEPFRRGAQTGAGLGLGLSIVKSLVELHGGRVSVSSEGPGTGSTFEVRLPRWRRRYAS
jgi:signal transduction histidine kinase